MSAAVLRGRLSASLHRDGRKERRRALYRQAP